MKTAKLIVIFIGIIAAFVCGVLIADRGEKETEIEEDCKKVDSRGVLPDDHSDSDFEQSTDFFEMAERKLASESLTFASVDSLYKQVLILGGENSAKEDDTYAMVTEKISAYHFVVDVLRQGNAKMIKSLDANNENMMQLNEYHRNLVLAIYYGDYSYNPPRMYAEFNVDVGGAGLKTMKLGQHGGLGFFIGNREYGDYQNFEDLRHMLMNRNFLPTTER